MKRIKLLIFVLSLPMLVYSLESTQNIKGTVYDKDSKMPMPGATVILKNSNPQVGVTTDENGIFRLQNVPLGRQGIEVSFLGYQSAEIDNIMIIKGKETVLEVEIEENVTRVDEIVVKATPSKDRAINQMATVSARTFSVEETEKYAGSRGDVARMAMNFAGVSAANDSRNDIVIRGNSPSGLLWRLDEVEIPNPNHFAENGTTGGPVGMLNNNLMQNSDFITGAFPAEYGNAQSGVFDLRLRNGNSDKHEFLGQVGFNGFELGAEGPINREKRSSYLINGRYSTLEAMDAMGVDFGTVGVPKYKDAAFKFNIPVNKGRISFIGLGGSSEIAMVKSNLSEEDLKDNTDLYSGDSTDLYNRSTMFVSGLSFTRFLSDKTLFKIFVSGLYSSGGTDIDTFSVEKNPASFIDHNYSENRFGIGGYVNSKVNSQFSFKTGVQVDFMGYDLYSRRFRKNTNTWESRLDDQKDLFSGLSLYRTYFQANYKLSENFTINPGVHFLYFDLNNSNSLEPRIGLSWQTNNRNRFNVAYGLHSKIQTLYTYFYRDQSSVFTNKDLGFTKSHQFVVGHDFKLTEYIRIKSEAYYQMIFDVPVEKIPSSWTALNTGANFGFDVKKDLENKGTGKNYGLEFTFEQFLNQGIYWLSTVSVFESKTKASDEITRNSAFNGNLVVNLLAGKEFRLSENNTLNIDLKFTMAGGRRYTPLDTLQTYIKKDLTYDESRAYELQFEPFIRPDIKFGFKRNSPNSNVTQEWIFYIENFINHKNPFMMTYNYKTRKQEPSYQLGFFPMMQYRINF